MERETNGAAISPPVKLGTVLMRAAMAALDEAGGELRRRDIMHAVEARAPLTDHDRESYAVSGSVRWQAILHFESIEYAKAGFIKKAGGRWYLTPEGKAALKMAPEEAAAAARSAFRQFQSKPSATLEAPAADAETVELSPRSLERSLAFEAAEAQFSQEIRDHIASLGPYEFQDLVAALLRGLGYSTPFIAPRGRDGGIDIVAYQDPLGAVTPHLRVQVKHRKDAKATREELAALQGIVRAERDIGIFVSTAGFSSDANREARHGSSHIELIDLDRFLELWTGHYEQLAADDKALLPLRRVYLLAPD
ncbi:MAG: restriction endonuclease [Rhodospirillales bacterium]|nr:restriction endonuclease [Rhodospirillales bacterium]